MGSRTNGLGNYLPTLVMEGETDGRRDEEEERNSWDGMRTLSGIFIFIFFPFIFKALVLNWSSFGLASSFYFLWFFFFFLSVFLQCKAGGRAGGLVFYFFYCLVLNHHRFCVVVVVVMVVVAVFFKHHSFYE